MTNPHPPASNWARTFFIIWTGQAFSLLGSQIAQFALIWWLTEQTASATVLAIASLVGILPGVVLGPLLGALVDRWNRKRIMMVADTVSAIGAGVLALLFLAGMLEVWHVYVVMFIRSIAGNFHMPAMQASTSLMVPQEQLSRVAGLQQMLGAAMAIAAPPLGALLLAFMPMPAIMAIDVVTALIAVFTMSLVMVPQPVRDTISAGTSTVWADIRAAVGYVAGNPGFVGIITIAVVINFLIAPAFALLPILVTNHYGGGVFELGWINIAWAIGTLLGGLLLSAWGGFKSRILTSLGSLILMGAALAVVGVIPSNGLWLGFTALLIAGVMNVLTNGPLLALTQSVVAPDMQGRFFTLLGSACGAMTPIGLLVAGPVADWLGITIWFLMGGIACVVLGAAAFFNRSIVELEHQSSIQPTAAIPPVLSADQG